MAEETEKKQERKMRELSKLFDIINTEDFISEVEKRPAIWDSRTEDYSNKTEKQSSWSSILKTSIPGFEKKPVAEQNILVSLAQRRWKSIRSSYARELLKRKYLKSGSNARKRKQYIHFEQLRFLETVSKTTTSCIDKNVSEPMVIQGDEIDPGTYESAINEKNAPKTKKRRGKDEDDEPIEILKKRKQKEISEADTPAEDRDEDRLFLLSLVSEIKKVPAEKKLKLRSDIISAIAAAQRSDNQQWPPQFGSFAPYPCFYIPAPPIHPSSSYPSSTYPSSHHQDPLHTSSRQQNLQTRSNPREISTSPSSLVSNSSADLDNECSF